MSKNIGISSYTYTWGVGVPGYEIEGETYSAMDLLKKAIDHQVGVLQIADNLPLHTLSDDELVNLKEEAERSGVVLEVGLRGIETEQLLTYLNIAKKLDSTFVRTIIHTSNGVPTTEQAIKLIKEVMPYYEAEKITLGIENHDRHTVKELIYIIETINSPYLGICLDTVNSFGALEPPETVIKNLAPYTVNLHYKDFKVERVKSQMGFSVVGCPAGEGQLDLNLLKEELKRHSKNPNIILELWTPLDETIEKTVAKENQWADQSIAYLKENF